MYVSQRTYRRRNLQDAIYSRSKWKDFISFMLIVNTLFSENGRNLRLSTVLFSIITVIMLKRKYIAPKLLQAKALSDATNVLLGNTYYGIIQNTIMYSVLWFNRVRTVAV